MSHLDLESIILMMSSSKNQEEKYFSQTNKDFKGCTQDLKKIIKINKLKKNNFKRKL